MTCMQFNVAVSAAGGEKHDESIRLHRRSRSPTGVHGVPYAAGSAAALESFTTIYVDVSCPDDH